MWRICWGTRGRCGRWRGGTPSSGLCSPPRPSTTASSSGRRAPTAPGPRYIISGTSHRVNPQGRWFSHTALQVVCLIVGVWCRAWSHTCHQSARTPSFMRSSAWLLPSHLGAGAQQQRTHGERERGLLCAARAGAGAGGGLVRRQRQRAHAHRRRRLAHREGGGAPPPQLAADGRQLSCVDRCTADISGGARSSGLMVHAQPEMEHFPRHHTATEHCQRHHCLQVALWGSLACCVKCEGK